METLNQQYNMETVNPSYTYDPATNSTIIKFEPAANLTATQATQAAMGQIVSVHDIIYLEKRIKTLEETSTHINVAKDQENRICELENAVTELVEFAKETLKANKEKKKIELENIQKALQYSQLQNQNMQYGQLQNMQNVPTFPVLKEYTGNGTYAEYAEYK